MVGTLLRNTLASLGCIIPFSIFFWREQHRDVQQKMSIIICAKQSDMNMKQSFLNSSIRFTHSGPN